MRIKLFVVIFFVLFSFLLGYTHEEKIEKTFKMDKDGIFKLGNVNGTIKIATHQKNEVFVKAVKQAKEKSHLADVKVKFEYEANKLKVYTERPEKKKTDVRVNFDVYLPEKLAKSAVKSVNGEVGVDGNYAHLGAKTVNGKLTFEGTLTDGSFATVNGGVGLYVKGNLSGNIVTKTVNGSVKIELPKDSSFKAECATVNGSIRSDFDLTVKKGFVGSSASGTVNDGKYSVSVKTVNGGIRLLKI
jgi:DUF4097 and DUF4098 domain-containing protein YvlB